jgi:hypothetical protein
MSTVGLHTTVMYSSRGKIPRTSAVWCGADPIGAIYRRFTMRTRTKTVGAGLLLGATVAVVVVPTLANGSARTSAGSGAAAAAVARPLIAQLTGANESPVGDPDGVGAAAVTIDQVTGEVCYDLRVANIATATLAHIHTGAAGVNGPVLVTFTAPNPTASACVTTTPANAVNIAANPAGFYVNIHNADFPGGAIRGQLAVAGVKTGGIQLLDEPLRAYDSRATGEVILAPRSTRVVSLAYGADANGASKVAVPPGAIGAMLRVTVTETVNAGYLKVYSNALTAEPRTSNVNWYASGSINGADPTVAVDSLARVKVTSGDGTTHFVIDVVGYLF